MDHTQILKRPLITEKCTWEGVQRNRFSFVVDGKAKKPQIKSAVEALFNVRVLKVSTQVRKGKYRRTRFGEAKTSNWKKATVQLHEDDKIDLF